MANADLWEHYIPECRDTLKVRVSPHLAVKEMNLGERGVFTSANLPAGEAIVQVVPIKSHRQKNNLSEAPTNLSTREDIGHT